eukprot:TRINITY_DN7973_c0_g1_i3.p1 TRINITY_DN7973_c0_g1~~TRINITY_DN7973_c0_g1_i3.p1  ORF type:complete len:258 (+),score=46.04 TRINITY_DN7973_c0_g1_i3:286-1059(+)
MSSHQQEIDAAATSIMPRDWKPQANWSHYLTFLTFGIIFLLVIVPFVISKIRQRSWKEEDSLIDVSGSPSKLDVFLTCFDPAANFRVFLPEGRNEGNLRSFHGARFIMIFWILVGHEYLTAYSLARNPSDAGTVSASGPFAWIVGGLFGVDAFFFIGGFFSAYIFGQRMGDTEFGPKEYVMVFIHRVLRFLPSLAATLFFMWKVVPFLGGGPVWPRFVADLDERCGANWWRDLLFIDNLGPSPLLDKMCVGLSLIHI